MTVLQTDQHVQCVYPSPWEEPSGATGVRPCRFPTSRINYLDRDQFPEGDPRRDDTVFPICFWHEVGLFAGTVTDVP